MDIARGIVSAICQSYRGMRFQCVSSCSVWLVHALVAMAGG